MNERLNCDNKKEQIRLKKEFPYEKDIFICKNKTTDSACYIKGRLKSTHTFGDFYLKLKEFNNPDSHNSRAYNKKRI